MNHVFLLGHFPGCIRIGIKTSIVMQDGQQSSRLEFLVSLEGLMSTETNVDIYKLCGPVEASNAPFILQAA